MAYQKVHTEIIDTLAQIVGKENVSTDREQLQSVAKDHTEDFEFVPEVLVKPRNAEEISQILKLANQYQFPVTPRGGGTGVSGGALPVQGGIVLSMQRLDQILEIDTTNRFAIVESGVITQVFQEAVEEKGLFFPPDPGSKGSCFLGGNLAESSGGPRSLKYGVTSDYVLNLEVVLPSGEIIWTGKNVTKNAAGYDLTKLICGSEGTLGIITKIVFRLISKPQNEVLTILPFTNPDDAYKTVQLVMQHGFNPVSMEFIDERSLEVIYKYHNWEGHQEGNKAYLWLEFDGETEELALDKCSGLFDKLEMEGLNTSNAMIAQTPAEKENLWTLRKQVGESIISYTTFKDIDAVVPISNIKPLLDGVQQIGTQFNFRAGCFGHIGNGNIHIQILKENLSDEDWNTKVKEGVKALLQLVNQLGGSLTGEHGVGMLQKEFLPLTVPNASINIMKQIKQAFDPHNILNPGKIF